MNTDNTLISLYCPHCKNRIETSLMEMANKDSFPCPTCHQEIGNDWEKIAQDVVRSRVEEQR